MTNTNAGKKITYEIDYTPVYPAKYTMDSVVVVRGRKGRIVGILHTKNPNDYTIETNEKDKLVTYGNGKKWDYKQYHIIETDVERLIYLAPKTTYCATPDWVKTSPNPFPDST